MAETKQCPKCGADLPADAPSGICPKCLMQAGLASEQDAGSTPQLKPTTLTSGFVPPESEDLANHFPQLEILELLGKGGMGAVYKARQPGLDRLVAVKILPPEVGADPAFAERFTREARALAKLSHQNIVSVFDSGEADGQYYFIMEYVDGANLRHVIETGAIQPEEALAIVPQICEALQFAHDEGIVHRDIKPENILVDKQGRVKIADFGLAKLLGKAPADVTLTGTHQAMGTMHYMAPEQMQGAGSVDHRADIFSLGVVFYEMLTGQLPIGKFEPPSKKVQIDVRLDEVVFRTLENEPGRRYQHASDVKTDVESISRVGPNWERDVHRETSDRLPSSQPQTVRSRDAEIEAAIDAIAGPGLAMITLGLMNIAFPLVAASILWAFDLKFDALGAALPAVPLGAIMLLGGVSMRKLGSHELSMVGTVTGMVPCGPVWLFSLPLSIWALLVLKKPEVKAAFSKGSTADSTLKKKPAAIAESGPRFSRKALLGACWSPFIFAALFVLVAPTSRVASRPDSRVLDSGGPESPLLIDTIDGRVQTVDDSDTATKPPSRGTTWWQWAVLGTVSLLALTAPFGTTILGVVSINDIRHSQGRLTGMPLAVADSLLFPLLALDGLIVFMCWVLSFFIGPILFVGYEYLLGHEAATENWFWLYAGITLLLSLPTWAYVDYQIVQAVWRKVRA